MKTRLIKNLLAVVVISAGLSSCSLEDDNQKNCSQIIGASTVAVVGPTTAAVNEEITLTVSYRVAAACGDFYAFNNQTVNATEKKIGVLTTYDVCNCDNVYTVENEPYKFKVAAAGTYTLNFATTNDVFIKHIITVE